MSYQYQYESDLQRDLLFSAEQCQEYILSLIVGDTPEMAPLVVRNVFEEFELPSGKFVDIFISFFDPISEDCKSPIQATMAIELKKGPLELAHVEQVLGYKTEIEQSSDFGYRLEGDKEVFVPCLPILVGYDDEKLTTRFNHIMDEVGVCVMRYLLTPHKGLSLNLSNFGDHPSMWLYKLLEKSIKNENTTD